MVPGNSFEPSPPSLPATGATPGREVRRSPPNAEARSDPAPQPRGRSSRGHGEGEVLPPRRLPRQAGPPAVLPILLPPARPSRGLAGPRTAGPRPDPRGRPLEAGGEGTPARRPPRHQPNFPGRTGTRAGGLAPPPPRRLRCKFGSGPSAERRPAPRHPPRRGFRRPRGPQAAGPAARRAGRGGVSGRRRPAGRAAAEVGGSSRGTGPAPEPPGASPPLTGAGARLPDLQQQDDDGRQVGQVPGQPEDVHGGGGRRGARGLGGSGGGSGGGGP